MSKKLNKPTEIQHYIRMAAPKELDKELVRKFFKVVKLNAPDNVVGTVQIEHPDKFLANVQLVHKKMPDKHLYIIPLTRDLLQKEVDYITLQWASKGMETIEASSPDLQDARVQYATNQDDKRYKEMSEEVAKVMHNHWMNKKVKEGWRFGTQYSSKEKTHPLLKPWEQLTEKYQEVDYDLPLQLLQIFKKYF